MKVVTQINEWDGPIVTERKLKRRPGWASWIVKLFSMLGWM